MRIQAASRDQCDGFAHFCSDERCGQRRREFNPFAREPNFFSTGAARAVVLVEPDRRNGSGQKPGGETSPMPRQKHAPANIGSPMNTTRHGAKSETYGTRSEARRHNTSAVICLRDSTRARLRAYLGVKCKSETLTSLRLAHPRVWGAVCSCFQPHDVVNRFRPMGWAI